MTTKTPSTPEPDDTATNVPAEEQITLAPGESVSLEVPANTNVVINVVPESPKGILGSLFSGLGCLFSGLFWLAVIFWIIVWVTP